VNKVFISVESIFRTKTESSFEIILKYYRVSLIRSNASYIWHNRKNYTNMLVCMLDAGVLDSSWLEPCATRQLGFWCHARNRI